MADQTDWAKGDLTPPPGKTSEPDWASGELTPPSSILRRAVVDPALSLAKGIVDVPEAAVGLADLVTGGQAGKTAENLGFRSREAKQIISDAQSPEMNIAREKVNEAKGFIPTVTTALANPSSIVDTTLESAPSMIGGGAIGRGFQALRGSGELAAADLARMTPAARDAAEKLVTNRAITAGAVGEGAVAAGQNTEQVRQEEPGGLLADGAAPVLAASGGITGLLSRATGGLANKFGLGDAETALVRGNLGPVGSEAAAVGARKGIARKVAEGFAIEGVGEELPQSYQEQVGQNLAQGKPWDEGAAEAGAQGLLAGGVTGAVVAPFGSHPAPGSKPAPAPNAINPDNTPLLPAPGYVPPGSTLVVDKDGNVGTQAQQDLRSRTQRGPFYEFGATGDRGGDVTDVVPRETSPRAHDMGIDANAGPLSAAAAIAVDSGAHQANQEAVSGTEGSFPNGIAAQRALRESGRPGKVVRADGSFTIQYDQQPVTTSTDKQGQLVIKSEEDRRDLFDKLRAAGVGGPGFGIKQEGSGDKQKTTITVPQEHAAAAQNIIDGKTAEGLRPFPAATGTLGVPRADMPQITPATHGALTQFLAARGIDHQLGTIDPRQLKPTQDSYSPENVKAQREADASRTVLISSDGYILDGTHQWLSKYAAGQPIRAIMFNAPIAKILPVAREFPSATVQTADQASASPQSETNQAAPGTPSAQPGTAQTTAQSAEPSPQLAAAAAANATPDQAAKLQPAAESTPAAQAAAPTGGEGQTGTRAASVNPLRVGRTPTTALPVTVRNGIVHIGEDPAYHYESGDPIQAKDGASDTELRAALKAGGVLSTKQRFFGGSKDETAPVGATTKNAETAAAAAQPAINSGEKADLGTTPVATPAAVAENATTAAAANADTTTAAEPAKAEQGIGETPAPGKSEAPPEKVASPAPAPAESSTSAPAPSEAAAPKTDETAAAPEKPAEVSTPEAAAPTPAQQRAAARETERGLYRDLSTDAGMDGKGVPEIEAAIRARLDGVALADEKIQTLAKAIHKQLAKTAAERAKQAHRQPEVLAAAQEAAVREAIPTIIDRAAERVGAVNAGFAHAMAGKTKSTLTGDHLADMLAGYEQAMKWRQTEEGKAWYEGRPVSKLQNTGLDLRRHWEQMREQMKAGESDIKKAWAQIERATTRADLFAPFLPENVKPGMRLYVEAVRKNFRTFKDWLTTQYVPSGQWSGEYVYRRESPIDKMLEGRTWPGIEGVDSQQFAESSAYRADWLRKAADDYLTGAREFLSFLDGKASVAEAAAAFDAKFIDAKEMAKYPAGPNLYEAEKVLSDYGKALATAWSGKGLWDASAAHLTQLASQSGITKQLIDQEATIALPTKATPLTPPRLDRVTREGKTDQRKGENVTPQQFKETFGFADVGFGKWVGSKQDQDHLNYAYDAFMDLANHFGVDPKNLGFGGQLHFTIGALGHGKFAAHFQAAQPSPEGSVQVINVTNTKGDGTVYHEWTHALDHNLGGEWKNSVRKRVLRYLTKSLDTAEQVEATAAKFITGGWYYENSKREGKAAAAMRALQQYGDASKTTAYKVNADKLGADYWGNNEELIARAAEAWAADTLGGTDTYLVNPAWVGDGAVTQAKGYRGTPYPTGSERQTMGDVYTALSKAIKWTDGRPSVSLKDFEAELPQKFRDGAQRVKELLEPGAMQEFEAELLRQEEVKKNAIAQARADKAAAEKAELDALAAEKIKELEPVVDAPTPAETKGPLSAADLGDIFDQAAAELREETQEQSNVEPPPVPGEATDLADVARDVASGNAVQRITKEESDAIKAENAAREDKTAGQLIKQAAALGVKGADEALKGLSALFGKPGTLRAFPGGMDEETYRAAKPHFQAALEAFQQAGKTLKDLFKLLIQTFGDGIKPYAVRFAQEQELTATLGTQAADAVQSPSAQVAASVVANLRSGAPISWQTLFKFADRHFGGTQAEGKYSVKDAYDALELGVNMYLQTEQGRAFNPNVDADTAGMTLAALDRVLALIPTQTKRTAEQDAYQQFSTVPTFAYLANWVANVQEGDVMLEPSAGVGGLAVFAKNAGARLILNELSSRRAALLQELFPGEHIYTENAEQLDNILPADEVPSVVVMNPPFSNSAATGVNKKTAIGAQHVEQALERLAPGGRLVAIVGEGMTRGKSTFTDWWAKIDSKYDVRAVIPVDGSGYAKYGTTFNNALLVIDKATPSGREVVTSPVATYSELIPLLGAIRNERANTSIATDSRGELEQHFAEQEHTAALPAGEADTGVGAAAGGADTVGEGQPAGQGPGVGAGGGRRSNTGRRGKPESNVPESGRPEPGDSGQPGAGGLQGDESGARVRDAASGVAITSGEAQTAELTDSIFESYQPQRLQVEGAKPHPGALVQSAAMASVLPPAASYTPNLPAKTITGGLLSLAQIEAVVYAGQAHAELLTPVGEEQPPRRGFFIGDGTGVGKGREIGGVILDNTRQGRKKHVWITEKQGLEKDAKRDFKGVGGDESIIFNQNKTDAEGAIAAKNGVLFTTYHTLRSGSQSLAKPASQAKLEADFPPGTSVQWHNGSADRQGELYTGTVYGDWNARKGTVVFRSDNSGGRLRMQFDNITSVDGIKEWRNGRPAANAKTAGQSRLTQLVNWLGKDFDGVLAFDEAHNAGNAVAIKGERGYSDPSAMAEAVVELQKQLPNARVLYVSATGATQVSNLSFGTRLGLWGPGTPFASVQNFIAQMTAGGLATMELVARDMKQMGAYLARSLSYDGITYSRVEQELTPVQRDIYDRLSEAWQVVLQNMNAALEETGANKDGKAKGKARSAFWGAQQRFFNQIITSMQMPAVLSQMEGDLAAGHAVVAQLVNTNEAQSDRSMAKLKEDDAELEELDLTPRDQLLTMVEKAFPVQQYEEYVDENGKKKSRPVMDAGGNPVLNRRAVAMRDKLLEDLKSIRVPDGPLEILVNHFGPDVVGEVTGRKQRVVAGKWSTERGDKAGKAFIQKRGSSANTADADAFQADKKRMLVFSDAGGTGFSFHSDLGAKNQRKRMHYLLQPGWRADKAVQGFGRTHRTNEANQPHYYLASTNIPAQKRFLSAIARRLDQLGALTKGQRDTANQGLFSEKDNLEGRYATESVRQLLQDTRAGRIAGLDFLPLLRQMGLEDIIDPLTQQIPEANFPKTSQFLNRMLSLSLDMQAKVFDAFSTIMEERVQVAIKTGELDTGVETIRALETKLLREELAYTDPKSGAETHYVELELTHATKLFKFPSIADLQKREFAGSKQREYVVNAKSGRVYMRTDTGQQIQLKDGSLVDKFTMEGTSGWGMRTSADFANKAGWKTVSESEAKSLWDAENEKKPKTWNERAHMIVGAILPIWDRINAEGTLKVVRTQTTDGRRLLGMRIHDDKLKDVLKRLNVDSGLTKMKPAEIMAAVLKGQSAELANGWKIERARVSNDVRIELKPGRYVASAADKELTGYGVISERIAYEQRYFIPTGPDGAAVLEKILKGKPLVDLTTPKAKTEDEGGDHAFSLKPAEAGKPAMAQSDIQRAVLQVTRGWAEKPPIHLVDGPDNPLVPPRVAAAWKEALANGEAVHAFHSMGQIFINVPSMKNAADVREALFHEVLGHFGLRGVFGDRLRPILLQLATMRPQLIAAKATEYRLNLAIPAERAMAAEEVLAELAATRPDIGWVRRTVAAIRTWLREHGFGGLRLSDDEIIRNYILPARGWVERSQSTAPSFTEAVPQAAKGLRTVQLDGQRHPIENASGQPIVANHDAAKLRNFWRWFGDSKVVDEQGRPLVVYRGTAKTPKADRFVTRKGRASPSFSPDPRVASVYARTPQAFGGAQYGHGATVTPAYLSMRNPLDLRELGEQPSLMDVVDKLPWNWTSSVDRDFALSDLIAVVEDLRQLEGKTSFTSEFSGDIDSLDDLADALAAIDENGTPDSVAEAVNNVLADVDGIDVYAIADSKAFTEAAKRAGFDGIIHKDIFDAGVQYYEGDAAALEGGYSADSVIDTYRPFEQNQIKSATGNNGEFSAKSDDIAFMKVRDRAEQAVQATKNSAPVRGLSEALDGIKRATAPESRSSLAKEIVRLLRAGLGEKEMNSIQFRARLNRAVVESEKATTLSGKLRDLLEKGLTVAADKVFLRNSAEDNRAFMQAMDTGDAGFFQAHPELKPIADVIARMFADKVAAIQALGTGALQNVRENYFPHIWLREPSGEAMRQIFSTLSKRPLEGQKGFTKQRVFEDVQAGLEAGFEPVSNNPLDLVMLKMEEMDKYILAHKTLQSMEGSDGVALIGAGEKTPTGYTDVNGRFGFIERGGEKMRYVARDDVAQVINNYLSPSLYHNKYVGKPFTAYMGAANTLNQFQLGVFSAFHAGFTSFEAVISHAALGLKAFTAGDLQGAAKYLGSAPAAWINNPRMGSKIIEEMLAPGSHPEMSPILQGLELAGFKWQMDNRFRTDSTKAMLQAWGEGRQVKAAAHSMFAVVEQSARPILEWLVPRQKFGVFGEMYSKWMQDHPDATHEELRDSAQQIWNRVDSRLGQVVYDRLFVHNVAKNFAQMLIRAPGWTGGTILEVGGGIKDLAAYAKALASGERPASISDRAAYTLSMLMVTAIANALLTALFTGKAPDDWKDLVAFRTGNVDEHGRPERFMLPTYMKDVFAYINAPGHTLVNKSHPLLSLIGDAIRNKDFYGTEVRNEDENLLVQTAETAGFAAKAFVPFWVRGVQKENEREGSMLAKALPAVGVMPAPSDLNKSAAEKLMSKYSADRLPQGARTAEEAEKADLHRQIYLALRKGESERARELFDEGRQKGLFGARDFLRVMAQSRKDPVANSFANLTYEQAQRVMAVATDAERAELTPAFNKKRLRRLAEHRIGQD